MHFDLENKIRTDGQFRHELRRYTSTLDLYREKSQTSQAYRAKFNETMFEFVRFCHFNVILLTSYYFPRYPKDRPLSFDKYPFAFQMFNFQIGGSTTIKGSRQVSKCFQGKTIITIKTNDCKPFKSEASEVFNLCRMVDISKLPVHAGLK